MPTSPTTVLIVGSGPTGLTLAIDLARRAVDVTIIDKTPQFPRSSRAKGPNSRSLEVLEDLGVIEEVLAAGSAPLPMRKYRGGVAIADADPFADVRPTPDSPYARPRTVAQWRLEEVLRDRLATYGVRVGLGRELVGLTEGDTSVTATLADGGEIEARYVVGCDGGHSAVRKLLGVPFEGKTDETQAMVCGDVEAEGPDRGFWHQWFDEDGAVMLCPIPGTRSGWWFQAGPETDASGTPVPPSLESFQRLFAKHTGLPGTLLSQAALLSTYRVNERMVDRYRVGRVFLAGDAAHVHSIAGGLGMNTGIQDAYNLGWKLARVASGQADPALLDTYEEERLPVAAGVLDLSAERLRATMEAIKKPGGGLESAVTPQTRNPGDGYPWSSLARLGATSRLRAGDRAPDAPCRDMTTGTPRRLFDAFAGPHFTLLGFGAGTATALREASAAYEGELRAYGVDAGTTHGLADDDGHARSAYGIGPGEDLLVLIRPDNHIGLITRPGDLGAVGEYLRAAALERA
ncbi:FAD-dependent monooxygenase [Streptomyces sp. NBC_01022]|uniref:FAD-dependent monooxygenase n=1 Tax=Streptomyces sp. NBC_01022 TaxID=2903723 RepID=UPI002DD999D0|nr:FAD-dependent monooxygenase [Streptomyces sp. NBC_01022]WRZ83692.1 FAD-dependent monooxygenase [Streptomyces sp. NBC_01022]